MNKTVCKYTCVDDNVDWDEGVASVEMKDEFEQISCLLQNHIKRWNGAHVNSVCTENSRADGSSSEVNILFCIRTWDVDLNWMYATPLVLMFQKTWETIIQPIRKLLFSSYIYKLDDKIFEPSLPMHTVGPDNRPMLFRYAKLYSSLW